MKLIDKDVSEFKDSLFGTEKVSIDNNQDRDNNPLCIAVRNGALVEVEALIKSGIDIDVKDERDVTPLQLATIYGHKEIAEILLINKANPNNKSCFGDTPMHNAASKSDLEMLKLLAKYGGDISAINIHGKSVLHAAASGILYEGERWEMIEWLLLNKVDYNAKTLGNVSIRDIFEQRDWSYAKHYDELLEKILKSDSPNDIHDY